MAADLEKLMNPDQETVEERVANELLESLQKKLTKAGKDDAQVAMRVVLMMADAINEAEEEG